MKNILRKARIEKKWKLKDLAKFSGIDQALVSKYENGKRIPSKKDIYKLSEVLDLNYDEIMVQWLKSKILQEIQGEQYAVAAAHEAYMELQEAKVEYVNNQKSWNTTKVLDQYKMKIQEKRPIHSSKIAEALGLEYTYESNRIEGNTLTLQETNLVVAEGMTVSGKSMREHLEALNHQEALSYIEDSVKSNTPITERLIKELHFLVLKGIDRENAGKYRDVQVMIQGSEHMPPQPFQISNLMSEMIDWYNAHKTLLHPVILAAEMHQRLVTIHPFVDGNGRTSRLLMNMILLQHGFVLANIKGDPNNRVRYYDALEKSQEDPDKVDFIEFIIDVEKKCMLRYLEILGVSI